MRTVSLTKKLSAFTVLFLSVSNAFSAATVETEFELFLSKSFQSSALAQKWQSLEKDEFHLNWPMSDQVLTVDGVEVALRGLNAKISTQLEQPVGEIHSQMQISSKSLSASLTISQIFVDQVVERTYGGITGRFRVQADCRNVQVDLKPGQGVFSVLAAPEIGAQTGRAVIKDFMAHWGADSFAVSSLNCTGVEGFADLLSIELKKVAESGEKFLTPYKDKILTEMNSALGQYVVDFGQKKILNVGRPDIRVWMEVLELKEAPGGSVLKGLLSVEFQRIAAESKERLKLEEEALGSNSGAFLRLPKSFVQVVAAKAFAANSWVEKLKSSQVSGFASLMRSRFLQFFLWPELMNFPKSSVFTFDLYSDQDLKISGGDNLLFGLTSNLLVQMNAPKKTDYVPFMHFAAPFSAQVKLTLSQGQLGAQILNPSLRLASSWNKNYLAKYSPSTRFSSSTVRNAILDALTLEKMQMTIPLLPLTEGLNLQVKSLEAPAQSKSVRVILAVSP